MLDYKGTGHSVMEMSHRNGPFPEIAKSANDALRTMLEVPDNFECFFLQGGANNQFAAICFNLLGEDPEAKGNYLNTGYWTERATTEAKKYQNPHVVATNKSDYNTCPEPSEWNIDPNAKYFHYCDNETIQGLQFLDFPYEQVPENMTIVVDMSSSICTKRINWNRVGVVYGGASKNVGPAGACVVIVRRDLIKAPRANTPMLLSWKEFSDAPNQFMNTPPCYTIYMCGLNLQHMIAKGGI